MRKILIIEDEAAIRRVLKKIISEENEGYEVEEAADGLQGLEMILNNDYDLVLCDIKMPKMDGVEAFHSFDDFGSWRFRHRSKYDAFGSFRLYFKATRFKPIAKHRSKCIG